MEAAVNGAVRSRRSRETSPDRIRASQAKVKPQRRIQVVYYLCRNGQLEHPHFMEITHHPNHQLRLKDIMDRMVSLRGEGMPSLFSWSCKRSYRNGYVWNDLAENDVVMPADGLSEYILKGSEIIEPSRPEGFRRIQLPVEDHEDEEPDEEKPWRSNPNSRRSSRSRPSEIALEDISISPPSSSSSDKTHLADDHLQPRSSVLLQLIACGSTASKKKKEEQQKGSFTAARKSTTGLHKEVLRRAAAAVEEDDVEDIRQMPLNPSVRREEKEYFSGSIVESFTEMSRAVAGPCLKKSNSYNEERSVKCGLGEVHDKAAGTARQETATTGEGTAERGGAAKCIPSGRKKTGGGGMQR